jgi:hypothetical protein
MIRKIVWSVVVAVLLGYIVYDNLVIRPVGSDSVIATPSPVLRRAPVVPVSIKAPVRTYQGATKTNLKLPAAVITDPQQQVIAASQVRADLRPQTVSTVINTETGKVETFVKTDPYPWLAWEPRGEARVAYGYKFDARRHDVKPVARLQVGYDVVRVKALTIGVTATLDSDRDVFLGVGVAYRW